jgi:hypothetical protein
MLSYYQKDLEETGVNCVEVALKSFPELFHSYMLMRCTGFTICL